MPAKFKIIISDLHLGAGRESEGNLLEDFGSDQEFPTFLEELAAESSRDGAEVELTVNGDAFELLQVPQVDTYDPLILYLPEDYHSSSEEDSVRKIDIIIDGHRSFFDALGRFIQASPPRRYVTFIKGNHDLNLHWIGVQDRIRQAVGATGRREALLTFEERRISREGIYVEHGNQYAEAVNRIDDMEEPHDHDNPGQLAIPLGSYFVTDVFNDVERERYWIDGVKPVTSLVWYALAYDFPFAARTIAKLIHALPGILREGVLYAPGPADEGLDERQALARRLEDPAQVEELAARYKADEAFRAQFNADVANLLASPPERLEEGAVPGYEEMPMPGISDPVAMGDQIRERVNSSLFEMAVKRAAEEGARLVVFGHTHDAGVELLPGGAVYINSGTWTWRGDFTGAGKRTWRDLFEHPERFTGDRQLSYVRVDYDAQGQPVGRLLAYELLPAPEEEPPETPPSFWERLLAWFRDLFA